MDSGNISRTVNLANSRFRLAVTSTTKRASSPVSWLSERQRMIKRARSAEFGSRKHCYGIPIISLVFSIQSKETWKFESASWNRCRRAFSTEHENTECHSESSNNIRDRAQQKRQARLWSSDSRRPGRDDHRGWWAFTRAKSPMPLKNPIKFII